MEDSNMTPDGIIWPCHTHFHRQHPPSQEDCVQRDGRRKACFWCGSSDMLCPSCSKTVLRRTNTGAPPGHFSFTRTQVFSCRSAEDCHCDLLCFFRLSGGGFLFGAKVCVCVLSLPMDCVLCSLDCRHHMVAELLMTYITARSCA